MAGPWEQYAQSAAPQAAPQTAQDGPWAKYAPVQDMKSVTVRPELEDQEFTLPADPGTGDVLEYVRTYRPHLRQMKDAELAREVAKLYEQGGISKQDFYHRTGLDKKILGFDTSERLDPTGSATENFRAGIGKAFVDTGRGLNQVGSWVADAIPGVDLGEHRADVQGRIDEGRRLDQPLMQTGAGVAGNIAGNVALTAIPGAPVARTAGWANRALRFGEAAARGGALGAIQPTATGESRGQNTSIGALAGLGGQAATSTLGRLARGASESIDPAKRAAIEVAQREGIPLHISQLSNSIPLKTAASVAKYVPFSGAGKAASNQQEAWNRAISRSFGVEAPQLTDDVIQQAKAQFNTAYDDIFSRNSVSLEPASLGRMQAVVREASKDLTADEARIVKNQFDRILDDAGEGVMTGKKYQSLRGTLAEVKPGTDVGRYVTKLRNELEKDAAKSLGEADAAALAKLNSQYNNMKTAENLLKQAAGAGGDIKPANLWAQVNKRGPKATKEMRDLAKVGQTLLKDPIPDSGSQGRLAMGSFMAGGSGLLGGPLGALGTMAAGIPASRLLNSPAFGNYIANGGGNTLQRLASGSRALPYLLPATAAGTQFGQEYLPPEPRR